MNKITKAKHINQLKFILAITFLIVTLLFSGVVYANTIEIDTVLDDAFIHFSQDWPMAAQTYTRGTQPEMEVYGYYSSQLGRTHRDLSFIKFDLSQIGDSSTISSIKLKIWANKATRTPVIARVAEDDWYEDGDGMITWENQPAAPDVLSDLNQSLNIWSYGDPQQWIEFELANINWDPATDLADNKLSLRLAPIPEITVIGRQRRILYTPQF